jgi:hypothetical protein
LAHSCPSSPWQTQNWGWGGTAAPGRQGSGRVAGGTGFGFFALFSELSTGVQQSKWQQLLDFFFFLKQESEGDLVHLH